ncbi:hypothetical protein N7493_001174 [Penicillium malachiteum]|uniref:Uncharacterized protein n=1 Tax=Penicillium malachiteum TaxID=1324776 RepID=A0AAD6MZF5_9EURO|nr:hypothetical protein N7493_001174 [Penicillium malachiteum]
MAIPRPQDHHNEKEERGEDFINVYSSYNGEDLTDGEGSTTPRKIWRTPSFKAYSEDSGNEKEKRSENSYNDYPVYNEEDQM